MAEISGLKLIVPSDVTHTGGSASVSATGKVTFSGVTQLNVVDAFSETYDNYLIVVRNVTDKSNAIMYGYLSNKGTPTSGGNNYVRQELEANHTSVTGLRPAAAAFWRAGAVSDENRSGQHIYMYGPFLPQPTAMRVVNVNGEAGALIVDVAGTHSLSTSYDGFSFTFSGGNACTGALTIYGLSQ